MKTCIFRTTVIGLLSMLLSGEAGADCGTALGGNEIQVTTDLLKQIEEKFGLTVTNNQFKCGGREISFDFKPSIQIVPANSFFSKWNTSFSLGSIIAEKEETNENLRFLLALPVEKIEALKLAQAIAVREARQIEENFGLTVSIWPGRFDESGAWMKVSSPACDGFSYSSAVTLGEIHVPVSNLSGMIKSPNAPFYQGGELIAAVAANKEILNRLDQVSRKIIESDKFIKDQFGKFGRNYSQCSQHFDSIKSTTEPFSWNKTRLRFGLTPVDLE